MTVQSKIQLIVLLIKKIINGLFFCFILILFLFFIFHFNLFFYRKRKMKSKLYLFGGEKIKSKSFLRVISLIPYSKVTKFHSHFPQTIKQIIFLIISSKKILKENILNKVPKPVLYFDFEYFYSISNK
jgi:hypothetical protein